MNDRLSNSAQAFNLNLVRFKNFRQRMNRAHDRETGALRQTVESFKQEASAYSDLLKRGPTAVGDLYDASHNALSWARLFERQLERMPDEAALGREMAFVYLMAILDGFVARWRIDMSLDAEGEKAESSRPNVIRDTCRELGIVVNFPNDFDRTLEEMRARRNILVHRGGIADERYCAVSGKPELVGKRLDVTEEYLDRADRFVTDLVWSLVAAAHRDTDLLPKQKPRP